MPNYKNRVQRLNNKLIKFNQQRNIKEQSLKTIPTDFKEFFSLLRINAGGKLSRFNLYDYQEESVRTILDNKTTICCKSRQMGYSQLLLGLILWLNCIHNGHVAVILSKTQEDCSLLAKRYASMAQGLVKDGYISIKDDNLLRVSVINNEGIAGTAHFKAASSGAVGLDGVSFLWFDECSVYTDLNETVGYAMPTTSTVDNPHIVFVGTPRGIDSNYFFRIRDVVPDVLDITEAISKGEEEPFQIHKDEKRKTAVLFSSWKCHPKFGKDENFLSNKALEDNLSLSIIKQEYDMCFTVEQDTLFDSEWLENLIIDYKPPTRTDKLIYFGLDTSGLTGKDYLVLTAFESDFREGKQQYTLIDMLRINKASYDEGFFKIKDFISKFPDAYSLNIELNSHGKLFYDKLKSLEQTHDMVVQGSSTTGANKTSLYTNVKVLGDLDIIKISSNCPGYKYILKEILNFKLDGTSKSDDIVSSIAYACIGISKSSNNQLLEKI